MSYGYRFAIVVGASSGIGREIARQLATDGARVAVVARRADRLESLRTEFPELILPFAHDVLDRDAVPALLQRITHDLGGLDLVVYAAGVMPAVAADEFNFAKDRQIVDVNLTAAMAWLDEVATRFQNVGHGVIVGIGSVAGERGRVGQPAYNASKAAFAVYLEALRNRLSRHGVRVVTVKPGPTATEITANLPQKGMMSASDVARVTLNLSRKNGEYFVKFTHRIAFAIIRALPGPIMRRLRI